MKRENGGEWDCTKISGRIGTGNLIRKLIMISRKSWLEYNEMKVTVIVMTLMNIIQAYIHTYIMVWIQKRQSQELNSNNWFYKIIIISLVILSIVGDRII